MTTHPIDPQIMKALERFTALVTVPVLYDDPKDLDQIGTGTLFTVDERVFLVTAARLFDRTDPARFSIPSLHTSQLHSLGRYNLLNPEGQSRRYRRLGAFGGRYNSKGKIRLENAYACEYRPGVISRSICPLRLIPPSGQNGLAA